MQEICITLISPRKNWTHLAQQKNDNIIIWSYKNPKEQKIAEKIKSENQEIIAKQGESVCYEIRAWRHKIMPKNVSMDPITYAIALQNTDIMQKIYSSWLNLNAAGENANVHMSKYRKDLKQKIEYRNKRYHLNGNFNGVMLSENRIVLNAKLPSTIRSKIYGKLKDIVGNKNIPEEAIITDIYENEEDKTVIAYDAEDIKLTDIFGSEKENAFIKKGQKIMLKIGKKNE